jgi:hypothetical protein
MNNNQLDAMFIFSLLSYHTSTCFGSISRPSSGGKIHICGKWYLLYCTVDCQRAWAGPLTVNCTVQGDQKVSVHLMITVQKTRKNILYTFNHLP